MHLMILPFLHALKIKKKKLFSCVFILQGNNTRDANLAKICGPGGGLNKKVQLEMTEKNHPASSNASGTHSYCEHRQ